MNVTAEVCLAHPLSSPRPGSAPGEVRGALRASIEHDGSAVMMYAGGEVDAANEHIWRRLLTEAAALVTPLGSLVVDVNGLDFMGCCAFAALAQEAERCRCHGVDLLLVSRQPLVARVVTACGLSRVLTIHPSVDCALSAAAAGSVSPVAVAFPWRGGSHVSRA
jgi:anti-anti-sigma factor